MLRFVTDNNFNGHVIKGVRRLHASIDLVRAPDVGIAAYTDPELLAWADDHNRVVLSHDMRTLPNFAYARMAAGHIVRGVAIVGKRLIVSQAIDEILLIDACCDMDEWLNRVAFLPL